MGKLGPDLTGRIIGQWTVLASAGFHLSRHSLWLCRCACGKEQTLKRFQLRGKTIGCRDCKHKRMLKLHHRRWWNRIRGGAITRQIEFSLTLESTFDLLQKQNSCCAITGVPISTGTCAKDHEKGLATASLDRIDSSKGYTPDNVQWVHKTINKMKWDLSLLDFVNWCKIVAARENDVCYKFSDF